MSGFVELCGPPGAGKSTLARALTGRPTVDGHGPSVPRPTAPATARPTARATAPATMLVGAEYLPLALRAPLDRGGARLAGPRQLAHLTRRPWTARLLRTPGVLLPASGSVPPDVAAIIAGLPGPAADDERASDGYRAQSLRWFEETLQLIRRSDDLPDDVTAVLSEGTVQRAVSLLGSRAGHDALAELASRSPTPRAIVHLRVDIALLEERASRRRARGESPTLHRELDGATTLAAIGDDARAIAAAVALQEDRGVPVLHLDAGASSTPRELADVVLGFLARSGV